MSGRSNPQHILASLVASSNDFAAGIAICVKALADATASPPSTPVMVEYRNRRMAFGRRQLAGLEGHVWYSNRIARYELIYSSHRKLSGRWLVPYIHKVR